MRRETTLAAGAAVVALLAVVGAVVAPGALANPSEDRPVRPGPVDIAGMDISSGEVTGDTVTLRVDTQLSHRGPPTRNVSLRVQAIDTESGLVATTRTVDVGDLTEERETAVPTNLTVEREGGYRIQAVVYRDGQRVDSGQRELQGLEALQPPYAQSDVQFASADALPPVAFSIAETDGNRTTLDLQMALTNTGDDQPENLRVTATLRQADSNIVANRADVAVGSIRPGRTETVSTQLTVPDGYNYYIDVVLWKDGVVIDSARGAANLDPTETISVNETQRDVELRVSDFSGGSGADRPRPEETEMATSGGGPGFGVVVAVVALLAAALLVRRQTNE
ncbi:PGF-CTERM protein [Haloplanus vescus]|uniref:PGF-CTERM protein n=1 Tax=Haloplanus vescus TaxID=555874 RepID=A0A1H3YNB0_9EURY|nr:PGF-CTERM sorting domain-containing protein [Haloplanus vescus]SEA12887.1 PGF-CTERM protein [Haloplanus vescus]